MPRAPVRDRAPAVLPEAVGNVSRKDSEGFMSFFWWKDDDGRDLQIYFSLCENGAWVGDEWDLIRFDYVDHYALFVPKMDVSEDVWDMLLQVLNLETT